VDTAETGRPVSRVRVVVLPLAVFVVVVAVVSTLVFTGVVQGDEIRSGPEDAPTTLPTVQIFP